MKLLFCEDQRLFGLFFFFSVGLAAVELQLFWECCSVDF